MLNRNPFDLERQTVWATITVGAAVLLTIALGVSVGRMPEQQVALGIGAIVAVTAGVVLLAAVGTRRIGILLFLAGFGMVAWNARRLSPSFSWGDALLLVSMGILLPFALTKRGQHHIRNVSGILIGAGLILFGGTLGAVVSGTLVEAISPMVRFAAVALLVPILVAIIDPGPTLTRLAVWAWVGGTVISSLVALQFDPGTHLNRVVGLTLHPNHLALTIVLATGPVVAIATLDRGWPRLVGLAAFALMGWAVLLSGSRAGIVGIAIACAVTLYLTRQKGLLVVGTFLGLGALFGILQGIIPLPNVAGLQRMFDELGTGTFDAAGADSEREELLTQALDRFQSYPLTGSGFADALAPHNLYLQILMIGGPLALLGIAIVGWITVVKPIKIVRQGQTLPPILAGLSGGYAGLLAAEFFQNVMWERYIWIAAALISCQIATMPAMREKTLERPIEAGAEGRDVTIAPTAGQA